MKTFIRRHTAFVIMLLSASIAATVVVLLYHFFSKQINRFFCMQENILLNAFQLSEIIIPSMVIVLYIDWVLRKYFTKQTQNAWFKYFLIHLYRHFTVLVRKAIRLN